MNGSVVASIDYRVEGHRVCSGAFAAVYSIPDSTMKDIARKVLAGDQQWVTYAMSATAKPKSDRPTLVMEATTWWQSRLRYYDILPHIRR
eukprot:1284708-Pleurochrysis_carterae.AAC.1